MLRSLHPNIKIRLFTSFLMRAVGTMIFPFMAIYLSSELGQALAGAIMLINVFASIIVGFYGGYIADRIGRRRVLIMGEWLSLAAFIVMLVVNSPWFNSPWITAAMMFVHGISSGLVGPAAEAMLIDASTKDNRKLMYSVSYWATNLSLALGSLLGGLFFKEYRFELFIGLAVVNVISLWLSITKITETHISKQSKRSVNVFRDMANSYKVVMTDKLFLWLCLASTLIIGLEFQLANYVSVRLNKEFIEQMISVGQWFTYALDGLRMASILMMTNTVLVVVGSFFVTKWMKRYRDQYVLYGGLLLFFIGYTIIGYSNNLWLLLACMTFATLGEIMYIPIKQSIMADIIHEDARSSYLAINGLTFQVAKVLGALGITIGAFVPSWGMAVIYGLASILAIVSFMKVTSAVSLEKKDSVSAIS
ncbi:major facilitator family transporter [Fictibacillus macauensis ZFHKF-1]|uniref:Major facilitator family transporter n=1 Tax=Fictibacillus macauensis ZFHKF-1 TaxID=1196324 RepID=I8UH52_9BACL|nr:MFS transporter [Fictibacillus macauensis]EIT86230.1 major facilitator family transporter [Fictibacillus macauensis ZFHKF-1]